jgi:TolB protein
MAHPHVRRLIDPLGRGAVQLLALLALLFAWATPAHAVLRVDITQGYAQPMPIAVTPLVAVSEKSTPIGQQTLTTGQLGVMVANVVSANLERSGLFRPIDPRAYRAPTAAEVDAPDFNVWRSLAAQALVTGRIDIGADGNLLVEFRLWDVFGESQLHGLRLSGLLPRDWRRMAHRISDEIYKRLTGESGYFDSRIVYIAESGPRRNRVKQLAIMDQDGANHRFLTNGQTLVLTPRFSPAAQQITYLAYYAGKPRVYLFDLNTGRHEVLGDFANMTFAPRFSPDGNRVVMTLAQNGNSDIYIMDLRSRALTRLTNHPGIDTAPSFAPDGARITFESNRGGSQQIYVMNADGSNVQRISFDRGNARYGTPVWSPRGDLIAFTKMDDGKFRIGVMRPDGSGERLLTDAWQDEGPTWSPNGRVILFFRAERTRPDGTGGRVGLWSVDLTGLNERRVTTPREGSDPAWSPLLSR